MTQVPPNKLKFKEHLEWDKKGMDLNLFLRKYEKSDDLKNKRVFYVIRPNADKNVYKIGIAGVNDGKAIGRFQQYRLYYGNDSRNNKCTGATVHFVCKTNYNKMVEPKNSYIHKLEKCMKDKLKYLKYIDRGGEWVKASLEKIKEIFDICSGAVKEIETKPRRSKRLQGFDDKYEVDKLVNIVDDKGQKKVEVKWKGYVNTTLEPYKNIEQDMEIDLRNLEYELENRNKL